MRRRGTVSGRLPSRSPPVLLWQPQPPPRCALSAPAGTASTLTKTEAPALVLGGTFVILATVNGAAQTA